MFHRGNSPVFGRRQTSPLLTLAMPHQPATWETLREALSETLSETYSEVRCVARVYGRAISVHGSSRSVQPTLLPV